MLATASPISQYFDLDGSPLDAGFLYFGQPNQNPQTAPVAVYWDAAGTQPAAQPVRTLSGYTMRSGKPAPLYAAGDYSLTVKDKRGQLIVYARSSLEFSNSGSLAASILAVREDLADTADALKNAGQIGMNEALLYNAGTLGAFARRLNPIRKYGALNNDGTTDDSGVFAAAIASGDKFIDARGVNVKIGLGLVGESNQVWLLDGATFRIAGTSTTCWLFNQKSNFAMLGRFSVIGDGTAVGLSCGIKVVDCTSWYVQAPYLADIKGWGFLLEPGTSTSGRIGHGTLDSPVIKSCYYGYEDVAGSGAEYCTVLNPRIFMCTLFGMKTCAGNTNVMGGHIVDNPGKGVWLAAGSNSAHGIFTGTNINHNGTFGIHADHVLNGFTFTGCHLYENDVWFDCSKGVHIHGGTLDANLYNYKDGTSGLNMIDGVYCPGDYGISRLIGANDGHDQLVVRNAWGPGVLAATGGKDTSGVTINDPTLCYVQGQRDQAANQALTSGAGATLTYSVTNYIFDRRGVLNPATGAFTIPAGQAGLYRVDFDLLFNGSSMSASASYVEVKVNGTSKKIFFCTINSSSTLGAQGSCDLYLNAADVVTLFATIVGTTPVFGSGGYPSNATLSRIA